VQCQIQLGELGNEWVVATCLFLQETVGKKLPNILKFSSGYLIFFPLWKCLSEYGLPKFGTNGIGAIWSVPMFLPVQGR